MDGNETCKACGKSLPSNVIMKHIANAKKCKEFYGDEFETLKRKKALEKKKTFRNKNRPEINEKHADYGKKNAESIKERKRKYYEDNADRIKTKNARYYEQHAEAIRATKAGYNKDNRISINTKKRIRIAKSKAKCTVHDRFVMFKQEIQDGPSFVCLSCQRTLFRRGVSILDDHKINELDEKVYDFIWTDILIEMPETD